MTRLGLAIKPEGSAWRKWLLGLPGMEWRLVFLHRPSGKSVEVWIWFCFRRWVVRRCRELGITLVGCGNGGLPSIPENGLLVNQGNAALVNSLLDLWRTAMRERGISPARARVIVSGEGLIGVLCAQALAAETIHLTLRGGICPILEPLLHRTLYETGVLIRLEKGPLQDGKGADAIILTGTDEDLRLGENFRGVWIYRLPGTSPLMVKLPGQIAAAGGYVRGVLARFFSRAWPGWVRGWLKGVPGDDGIVLPADYSETLLMALEGGDKGFRCDQADRLEYLHQVRRLGIDYQLATVQLDFP